MAKNTHELLGIAVEQLDNVNVQFDNTLQLLSAIKSGEISIDRVTITKSGWNVAEAKSEPDGDGEKESAPEVAGQVGTGAG